MTWQPIETAPKGKLLVFYFPPTKDSRGNPALGEMFRVGERALTIPRKPTHWMPLPDPPKP